MFLVIKQLLPYLFEVTDNISYKVVDDEELLRILIRRFQLPLQWIGAEEDKIEEVEEIMKNMENSIHEARDVAIQKINDIVNADEDDLE